MSSRMARISQAAGYERIYTSGQIDHMFSEYLTENPGCRILVSTTEERIRSVAQKHGISFDCQDYGFKSRMVDVRYFIPEERLQDLIDALGVKMSAKQLLEVGDALGITYH